MSFRSFEFETAPEKWYNSVSSRFEKLFDKYKTEEIYRVLLGLYFLWKTTGKRFDNIIFSMAFDAISKENSKVKKPNFFKVARRSEQEKNYIFFAGEDEQIVAFVRREQEKGRTVGLKFGHYRRPTVPHILEINKAYQTCDSLILIIESAERTTQHKTKRIELSDQQRLDLFTNAGLANVVLVATGDDYSNEYYRKIVSTIKPDLLYASADWSQEMIEEYKLRAKLAQAKMILLPTFGDYHVSNIEKHIFPA